MKKTFRIKMIPIRRYVCCLLLSLFSAHSFGQASAGKPKLQWGLASHFIAANWMGGYLGAGATASLGRHEINLGVLFGAGFGLGTGYRLRLGSEGRRYEVGPEMRIYYMTDQMLFGDPYFKHNTYSFQYGMGGRLKVGQRTYFSQFAGMGFLLSNTDWRNGNFEMLISLGFGRYFNKSGVTEGQFRKNASTEVIISAGASMETDPALITVFPSVTLFPGKFFVSAAPKFGLAQSPFSEYSSNVYPRPSQAGTQVALSLSGGPCFKTGKLVTFPYLKTEGWRVTYNFGSGITESYYDLKVCLGAGFMVPLSKRIVLQTSGDFDLQSIFNDELATPSFSVQVGYKLGKNAI